MSNGSGKIIAIAESVLGKIAPSAIQNEVDEWLGEHITNPNSPPLDRSLSSSSSAAPADMVGDLNRALSLIENFSDTYNLDWVIGGLNNYGVENENTNRIRTGYIDVNNDTALHISIGSGYDANVLRFDKSKTRLSASSWMSGEHDITLTDLGYIRVAVKRLDDADMSVSEGSNIIISFSNELFAKIAELESEIDLCDTAEDVNSKLANGMGIVANGFQSGTIEFSNGKDILISGKAIDSSGAEITNVASYDTDFIKVYPGYEIEGIFSYVSGSIASTWYQYIFFYDVNKSYIASSRVGGKKYTTVKAVIPDNASYIRVSLTYINSSALDDYTLTLTSMIHSPKNKWYVLGDSISAGYYSMTESMAQTAGVTFDYNSPVTTDQGEATGSVWDKTLKHNYWGYANRWSMHRELIGKAYPGQGYFEKSANNENGIIVVNNTDFSDAGMITVAWGFNDWHYNDTRGTHDLIDPSIPYPTENYDTTQLTTINHAIWYCLGTLIRKAPNAMIIVQTPMNGWAYGGDWDSNWGLGTVKSNSGTLANIHDDIVYWANYYGLQILEMTYNNSVVNRRNIKDTIIDGSHPSDIAHQQLGRHVAIALQYG